MKKVLCWPLIIFVRVVGAAMHLMFMQADDAKSVLLTGECRRQDFEVVEHRRERATLTSDEVCMALTTESV